MWSSMSVFGLMWLPRKLQLVRDGAKRDARLTHPGDPGPNSASTLGWTLSGRASRTTPRLSLRCETVFAKPSGAAEPEPSRAGRRFDDANSSVPSSRPSGRMWVFAGCLRATAGGWLQTSARRSFGASECGGLRLVAEGEGCSPRTRVHSYGEWPGGWWLVTPRSPHGLPGVRGDVRLRSDMDVEKPGTTELAPTTESVIEWARHSARTDEQACSTRTSVRDVGVDQASRLPGNAVLRRCGTGRPADCSGGVSLLAARGQTV